MRGEIFGALIAVIAATPASADCRASMITHLDAVGMVTAANKPMREFQHAHAEDLGICAAGGREIHATFRAALENAIRIADEAKNACAGDLQMSQQIDTHIGLLNQLRTGDDRWVTMTASCRN